MNTTYPAGPASVPDTLTAATPAYKQKAWIAMIGLMIFVLLYFFLASWFAYTAYKLFSGMFNGTGALSGFLVGSCAAFLAIFMLKALFFVKHGGKSDDIEITAAEQPRLFEFLHRLADEAGAPRPHRVFLSPRVNAAVFYDLSIINLLFPSKKNLEIGLGLVNVVNLGELKAVLAHEFGHFAQRSMAVGRWVYVAQQIAAHIVGKRDALDNFLRGLSRTDFRIAWLGWLLSLIVWSIRSLLDTAFSLVILAQRALSREMEMQADLVAVSLTGSDALIHALHRLEAADEAWDRAINFANGEFNKNRNTYDLFAIQSRVVERMRDILDDPAYGNVSPVPGTQPAAHRIFKAAFAQPPRMWSSHPFNHEREENAKRIYIHAPLDERRAWEIFDNETGLREKVSASLMRTAGDTEKLEQTSTEDSLKALDEQFEREFLKHQYRGAYLGRSVVRDAARVDDLYNSPLTGSFGDITKLYPESLSDDLEKLRSLEKESSLLKALRDGTFSAPEGVIRHRGKELQPRELPNVIDQLATEISALETKISAHDRQARTAHRVVAAKLFPGWDAHLVGLAQVLHYADHTEANLRDAEGLLVNTVNVVTATKVNKKSLARILTIGTELQQLLGKVASDSDDLQLDAALTKKLGVANWKEMIEEYTLGPPTNENINNWMNVVHGWVNSYAGALSKLRQSALEELLIAEGTVARAVRDSSAIEAAPTPAKLPADYPVLLRGKERQRQNRLGWWGRFQNADGLFSTIARSAVACTIVAAVLSVGGAVGDATITIYNGLARPVIVNISGKQTQVAAFKSASLEVKPSQQYKIETKTINGKLIEAFDTDAEGSFTNHVYNVASASPLVEWTAVYGGAAARPDRKLGAPRWTTTRADVLFAEPPKSISTKSGGGTKSVLAGFGDKDPNFALTMLGEKERDATILSHARWDEKSSYVFTWLAAAIKNENFAKILAARLKDRPDDLLALRFEQDAAAESMREQVCARQQEMARAKPDNSDLQYIASRCIVDKTVKKQAFIDGYAKWPKSGWFAYAAGNYQAEEAQWSGALITLEAALKHDAAIAPLVETDIARIKRMVSANGKASWADIGERASFMQALETGEGLQSDNPLHAYVELAKGNIDRALEIAKKTPENEARLLRLAAASDGASGKVIDMAFALPTDKGLDASTAWTSIALATRNKLDTAPYMSVLKPIEAKQIETEQTDRMLRFIEKLREGGDVAGAEKLLDGLYPENRGQAYSIGVIILGKNAPAAWRNGAKRLLFASERPYFS